MRTLSMTREQFDAEGIRLDTEFQRGFALDMIRSGKIGGKKVYFKDPDGQIKSKKKKIWARVNRVYTKKERRIEPALPQYADVEDNSRSLADMNLQIENFQDRYNRCRDVQTGEILTGEARKEWEKGRESRRYYLPEKARVRGGLKETDTIHALKEVFAFVAKLDVEGIKRYQELVTQYKDGDEENYPKSEVNNIPDSEIKKVWKKLASKV